jgi:hypothetical protein
MKRRANVNVEVEAEGVGEGCSSIRCACEGLKVTEARLVIRSEDGVRIAEGNMGRGRGGRDVRCESEGGSSRVGIVVCLGIEGRLGGVSSILVVLRWPALPLKRACSSGENGVNAAPPLLSK